MYGFDPTETQVHEGRGIKEGEGLVMIPGTGDVGFYLNTVLADFASGVLWEFSNLVRFASRRNGEGRLADAWIPGRPT